MNAIINSPLSDKQISKYFDEKPNIVMMKDISNMTSLEQVFNGYDHVVLFIAVNGPNDGHWELMYISDGELHFFDSYGYTPCQVIKDMSKQKRPLYGQNGNLNNLILNSPFYPDKCFANRVKYQKDNASQTCGRYVSLNYILLHIYKKNGKHYDGEVFQQLMKGWQKKFKKTDDYIVSYMIDDIMN
jgi:hypothetical protein